MMIPMTDEQNELYDRLMTETDPEVIAEIHKRLAEIREERKKEWENCPFVH